MLRWRQKEVKTILVSVQVTHLIHHYYAEVKNRVHVSRGINDPSSSWERSRTCVFEDCRVGTQLVDHESDMLIFRGMSRERCFSVQVSHHFYWDSCLCVFFISSLLIIGTEWRRRRRRKTNKQRNKQNTLIFPFFLSEYAVAILWGSILETEEEENTKRTNNKYTLKSYVKNLYEKRYICMQQEEKQNTHAHTRVYCWSKKSVVGWLAVLAESFIVVWSSVVLPGFFITVTRPPNSSNRKGVVLLLAQMSWRESQRGHHFQGLN